MWNDFIDWIQASGPKVATILLVAWLFNRFSMMIVRRIVKSVIKPDHYASEREERLREKTIISIVGAFLRIAVWLIAVMIILTEFDIDIGPLLAGAGVVGFAVGFGAQELIKDFIAGIFIVLENQYRVGDVVNLGPVSGTVEHISMRSTVLRDLDGDVHHIPNGKIEYSTNKTMEFARINMNIGVSYSSDMDKVKKTINKVGQAMAEDEEWKDKIIEPLYFARINEFNDSSVQIKIFGKVLPAKQWAVAGEFRWRLKAAFDKAGIEIPFPQLDVHQRK